MKPYTTLLLVVLGVLHRVQTFPATIEDPTESTVWAVPQRDGSVRWMSEDEAIMEASKSEGEILAKKPDRVRFFLYTQSNPTEPVEIKTGDFESLERSAFDFNNPTRLMIHGFNGYYLGEENNLIREALLLNGENKPYNFISVDWSVYSETINYISAKNGCSKTGAKVAELIDWMHDNANLSFASLALYGHSLGAHVAGFTGKKVQRGRVHTIIGLDPAMPLFSLTDTEKRLSDSDAEYVETIHTNGGMLGFYNPIGQASFYPNGGRSQPGCGIDLAGGCSHGRSVIYLAEALRFSNRNGFQAIKCRDFESLKNDSCNLYSEISHLGDPNNHKFASGIYHLETNSESLFGIN